MSGLSRSYVTILALVGRRYILYTYILRGDSDEGSAEKCLYVCATDCRYTETKEWKSSSEGKKASPVLFFNTRV